MHRPSPVAASALAPRSDRGGTSRRGLTRRACLSAFALPWLLSFDRSHAAAPGAGQRWVALFAGPTGGPVFWLSRSTEFVVVDGVATPVKGRVSAIAAVSRPGEGGTTRVSYLLQGCNLAPGSFDLVKTLTHPITGEDIPTAVTPPLKLGWTFHDDGEVTEELVAANGTHVSYRGAAWDSPGTGDERSATLKMSIRLVRPKGEIESFTEVSVQRPRAAATRNAGFTAAESDTFTERELTDKSRYPGATTVLSLSMGHADNHPDVDGLRRALRPGEAAALSTFFGQQADWAKSL